ncbi:transporter [Flavobacterium sp.]|uniref:transporter n=1 Tax=Flavobacterium sp. TaxID=239 RepID=UPI0028BEAA76|nr:transporter [Flavobacterium sp.]
MKKYILFYLLLFLQNGWASELDSLHYQHYFKRQFLLIEDDCDACGCSASGGSMGFSSMLNSNFVCVRYFYQSYRSNDKLYTNSVWHNENFNTVQLWARIPVLKKIQLTVLAPYHFNNRTTDSGNQSISGIGDVTVLGMCSIYQTQKDSATVRHNVQLGAGVKAPIGKFDEKNNGSVNPSFQLGTGSWDYLIASEYVLRYRKFGLNTMANYIVKTENEKNYRFGNQWNYAGTFFYVWEKDLLSLAPQLGIAGEVYESNVQHKQRVRDTSGDVLFGKIGFEINRKKFSFGANTMFPIQQNLNGGKIEAQYRLSFNLNYTL